MCRLNRWPIDHHRDVDEFTGPFEGWTKEQRQAWHSEQVARFRALYERQRAA